VDTVVRTTGRGSGRSSGQRTPPTSGSQPPGTLRGPRVSATPPQCQRPTVCVTTAVANVRADAARPARLRCSTGGQIGVGWRMLTVWTARPRTRFRTPAAHVRCADTRGCGSVTRTLRQRSLAGQSAAESSAAASPVQSEADRTVRLVECARRSFRAMTAIPSRGHGHARRPRDRAWRWLQPAAGIVLAVRCVLFQ
jgi:hypothetical protein